MTMFIPIITKEDLERFKQDVINELKSIVQRKNNIEIKWIKSPEAKKILGVSNSTLQNLRTNGTLSYTKVGGSIYYNVEEIEKLMEENKISNKV